MSRSGYVDDLETINLYRANVDRSIKGKRGQAFLRDLAAAMDAMPEKVLIAEELVTEEGDVCAVGAYCQARGIDATSVDPDEPGDVAKLVKIARPMAAEIAYINDECGPYGRTETPEERWQRVRKWVADNLVEAEKAK